MRHLIDGRVARLRLLGRMLARHGAVEPMAHVLGVEGAAAARGGAEGRCHPPDRAVLAALVAPPVEEPPHQAARRI